MDSESELNLDILLWCKKKSKNSWWQPIKDYKNPEFSDSEIVEALENLITADLITTAKPNLVGCLSIKGEKYLKELLQQKDLESFKGKLSKYWYGTAMLIFAIVTVIYVILDYYLK